MCHPWSLSLYHLAAESAAAMVRSERELRVPKLKLAPGRYSAVNTDGSTTHTPRAALRASFAPDTDLRLSASGGGTVAAEASGAVGGDGAEEEEAGLEALMASAARPQPQRRTPTMEDEYRWLIHHSSPQLVLAASLDAGEVAMAGRYRWAGA